MRVSPQRHFHHPLTRVRRITLHRIQIVANANLALFGGASRILCVDDDRDTADSEAMLLQLAGFDARACYCGRSALIEAADFLPDICLIDMNMPGMDGDEVAARLRGSNRPPAIVAVSAMNDEAGRRRMEAAGFDLHLLKPVAPRDLIAAVGELQRPYYA